MTAPVTKQDTYLPGLARLAALCETLPRTRMMAIARLDALVMLCLEIERLILDRSLDRHPFPLVADCVDRALHRLETWRSIGHVDGREPLPEDPYRDIPEEMHRELFQMLWTEFTDAEYRERIDRFGTRLADNGLADGFLANMDCLDLGCGHANFDHALLAAGARRVIGVDVGLASLVYARAARVRLGVPADRLDFCIANVKRTPFADAHFDFVLQNGVFHHLDDEDSAYRELARVLKPGGWAWIYNEGEGSIGRDVFAACVPMLADIPARLVLDHFRHIGIETGKRYHLSDGLNAIYRPDSRDGLIRRLRSYGFVEFRMLKGSFPTDYDVDPAHPFSAEKFGEGDLRILARKG